MNESRKTYWQELNPLWLEDVKSWFGLHGWKQNITNLVVLVGIIYALLALGQTEDAMSDIRRFFISGFIGAMWLLYVSAASYVTANMKLYQNQVEKRKELGEFSENPFRIEIHKPNRKPERGESKRVSLEIHNDSPNKKIEHCHVRFDDVFHVKGKPPTPHDPQNLSWNARESVQLEYLNQPLDISAGDYGVCDIAIAKPDANSTYYLTWVSEKVKEYIDSDPPVEYILSITVYGSLGGFSKKYPYHFTLIHEGGNEISLKDVREGEYENQQKGPA